MTSECARAIGWRFDAQLPRGCCVYCGHVGRRHCGCDELAVERRRDGIRAHRFWSEGSFADAERLTLLESMAEPIKGLHVVAVRHMGSPAADVELAGRMAEIGSVPMPEVDIAH